MKISRSKYRIKVSDADIGLFQLEIGGEVICISEYASKNSFGEYSRDAYLVSSGENYCGGDERLGYEVEIDLT